MKTLFPVDPELTALVIAHSNPAYALIARRFAPRSKRSKFTFSWTRYNDPYKAFRLPETKVGPTGKVNQVQLPGERVVDETEDDALDFPLSFYDSQDRAAERRAAEFVAGQIQLRHEITVAAAGFNPDNYEFKTALVGAEQLNHADYEGNPVKLINSWLGKPLMRPNKLTFGSDSWSEFSTHGAVLKAVHGNSGDSGIATPEQVANLFRVKEVLIGEGRICTSKPGEAPELALAWGPHIAGTYIDESAAEVGGVTFAFTAEHENPIAGVLEDKIGIGMRGGKFVRAGESTKLVTPSKHCGFLLQNVVTPEAE